MPTITNSKWKTREDIGISLVRVFVKKHIALIPGHSFTYGIKTSNEVFVCKGATCSSMKILSLEKLVSLQKHKNYMHVQIK